MAFLGVRWVPTRDTHQRLSESSILDLAEIVRTVRAEGAQSLLRSYNEINAQYAQSYQNHQILEARYAESNGKVDQVIKTLDLNEKKMFLAAGQYFMEGDSRYSQLKDALKPAVKAALDRIYIPHLQLTQQKQVSEEALWLAHSNLTNAQAKYELWNFEQMMAVQHQAVMQGQLVVDQRRQQWFAAGNESRLQEIRAANKEKRRQQTVAKQRRAEDAKREDSSSSRSVRQGRDSADSAVAEGEKQRGGASSSPRTRRQREDRKGGDSRTKAEGHRHQRSSLRPPGDSEEKRASSRSSSRESGSERGRSEGKPSSRRPAHVDGATWL